MATVIETTLALPELVVFGEALSERGARWVWCYCALFA